MGKFKVWLVKTRTKAEPAKVDLAKNKVAIMCAIIDEKGNLTREVIEEYKGNTYVIQPRLTRKYSENIYSIVAQKEEGFSLDIKSNYGCLFISK